MTRDDAITTAIELCIKQDILKTYLEANYTEAIKMLNYEYDAEAERRVIRQEGRREGRQEGIDLVVKLLQAGLSADDAIAKAKRTAAESIRVSFIMSGSRHRILPPLFLRIKFNLRAHSVFLRYNVTFTSMPIPKIHP